MFPPEVLPKVKYTLTIRLFSIEGILVIYSNILNVFLFDNWW